MAGYLARLGGGCQARVSPVVAAYGHHTGVDFVAQFQGEHGQQHVGGDPGEEGSGPRLLRGAGLTRPGEGTLTRATQRQLHQPESKSAGRD